MPQTLKRIWRIARIPLGVVLILYIGLVIYRVPAAVEKQKTQEAVGQINAQKITLDDVMGTNLPPVPDQALNDSTVEGIDANKNGIRDDVELAISKEYSDSAHSRASRLQYAGALQSILSKVINTETWIAAAREKDRSLGCIWSSVSNTNSKLVSQYAAEIKDLVVNTELRQQKYNDLNKYRTSYLLPENDDCDIDLTSLPD